MTDETEMRLVRPQDAAGARKAWIAPRIDDASVLLNTTAKGPQTTNLESVLPTYKPLATS